MQRASKRLKDKPADQLAPRGDGAGPLLCHWRPFSWQFLQLGLSLARSRPSNMQQTAIAQALTHGDADRAPALITRYGCGGCHTILGTPLRR